MPNVVLDVAVALRLTRSAVRGCVARAARRGGVVHAARAVSVCIAWEIYLTTITSRLVAARTSLVGSAILIFTVTAEPRSLLAALRTYPRS